MHGPQSFQQLIPELYQQALDSVEEFLCPSPNDLVIDLYCGVGASMLRWKKRKARILGIELGKEAVECAKYHVEPEGGQVLQGRCSHRIPQMTEWTKENTHASFSCLLVFANPPRTGLEREVLEWLTLEARPTRVAYLSCSAGTLARDLRTFEAQSYKVQDLIPWDFFPQTHHVETLALISRN